MYALYCALDIARNDSQVAWSDADGNIVREKKIKMTRDALVDTFARDAGRTLLGCEATGKAFWIHDVLSPLGIELRIAPPNRLKVIYETCYKTDRIDARKMAQLMAKDLFPTVWIPPAHLRDLREMTRLRAQMVRARSQWACRHHALLSRWGVNSPNHGGEVVKDRDLVDALGDGARIAGREILRFVGDLNERIRLLDRRARTEIRKFPDFERQIHLLMTIPGVGILTATVLVLEIGRIDRFPSHKHFAHYSRLTPGVDSTAGRRKDLHLAKDSRADLGCLMVEAAWTARRVDPYFAGQYQRRVAFGIKPRRAIVPVARSLSHAIYRVWKSQTPYQELFQLN